MIFVWSGRGFLLLIIWIASAIASIELLPKELGIHPAGIASFITAAFGWYFGKKWNNKEGRIVIDEQTGERLEIREHHTFFWIKMQYWGIIFSILGVIFLASESILAGTISLIIICAFFASLYFYKRNKDNSFPIENSSQMTNLLVEEPTEEVIIEKGQIDKEDPSRFIPQ